MKKYIIPTIDVVNMDFYPLLQALSKGHDYQPDDPVLAPQYSTPPNTWDETSDEEE